MSDRKQFWPQPATPLRGEVVAFTFEDVRRLRRGEDVAPELAAAFVSYRASSRDRNFSLKPKRNSLGLIWNGRPFYWSFKGYYRNGRASGPDGRSVERRPLQHYIWEAYHRRKMPRLFEIWFKDRDHHNFEISNLECLHKSEVHRRTIELGEVRQLTFEERSVIRGRWGLRKSRNLTSALLCSFQRKQTSNGKSYDNDNIVALLRERTNQEDRSNTRRLARAGYERRRQRARQAA